MSQSNNTMWASLFIPAMPMDIANEEILTNIVENVAQIGKVKRVDLVKKQGPTKGFMAFVHLDHWYGSYHAYVIRDTINVCGFYDCLIPNRLVEEYNTRPITLRFMQNKTPIKDTELNVHQLAANQEIMEKTIKEQAEMIEKLRKELDEQKAMLANIYIQNQIDETYVPEPLTMEDLEDIKLFAQKYF